MYNLPIEKFTLSRSGDHMEGWPDLIRTQSGKLLCVYNECVSHGNRDHTHITLRESTDGGRTWSEKRYIDIETFSGDQWNSIRINQLRGGRILLVCDRIRVSELSAGTEMWIWESRDDGVTWSEGVPMGIFGYCSDKVRELRDGTLLLLVSSFHEAMGCSVVYAHLSRDGGRTWSERIHAAADLRYNLIEPAALEMSDGTLVAFLRENSGRFHDCMRIISKDGGRTWSGVHPIAAPACHRPSVGFLSDGRILMTYRSIANHRIGETAGAVFSEETATSPERGDGAVELFRLDYDRSATPDTGYTGWTELDGGTILAVNYIVDDAPRAYIRGYFFRLEDLR